MSTLMGMLSIELWYILCVLMERYMREVGEGTYEVAKKGCFIEDAL